MLSTTTSIPKMGGDQPVKNGFLKRPLLISHSAQQGEGEEDGFEEPEFGDGAEVALAHERPERAKRPRKTRQRGCTVWSFSGGSRKSEFRGERHCAMGRLVHDI